jgi:hypothetical protein
MYANFLSDPIFVHISKQKNNTIKTMEVINQKKLVPTFSDSFGNGWEVMSKNFLILLLVVIILAVIGGPPMNTIKFNFNPGDFNWHGDHFPFFSAGFAALGALALIIGIFALAYSLLLVPIFEYGGDLMFVHAVRDIKPEFETLIKGFKENYLHIVLANLLVTALTMMGFLFCIVPGIIVACRLVFVSYLVMDKKLDPIVAVEESWRLTKGYGWTIFAMGLASFFIIIAGLICCFVGVLPASMWIKSSFASLYEAVLQEKNVKVNGIE